jgi:hypothetical protein
MRIIKLQTLTNIMKYKAVPLELVIGALALTEGNLSRRLKVTKEHFLEKGTRASRAK